MKTTPVIGLSLEEEAFFEGKFKLRCAEATEVIGKLFKDALDQEQKPVQFSQQTYAVIRGSLMAVLAHMEARLDVIVRRENALLDRIAQLESQGVRLGQDRKDAP